MSQFMSNQYPLGKTAASGENEHLLGQPGVFKDLDLDSTERIKPELSAMLVHCVWVKNETGGALSPGESVTWDTGATYGPFKAVGAQGGASAIAGFVDPYVTTVADNEHFWLVQEGPCKALYDGSANLAIGDKIATAATGRVAEATLGTTDVAYTVGVKIDAAKTSGSADDEIRIYAKLPIA
jgi:hypothetical protein